MIIIGMLGILTLLIVISLSNNKCVACDEPLERCKTCKNYKPIKKPSFYEPKEFDIDKSTLDKFNQFTDEEKEKVVAYWNKKMSPALSKLADKINNLTDEEFRELDKQVKSRGYEDGRD